MVGEPGDTEGAYGDIARPDGRRSRMPLYLTTFLLVVVGLERLIDHVLA